jgi:hypothetical protein
MHNVNGGKPSVTCNRVRVLCVIIALLTETVSQGPRLSQQSTLTRAEMPISCSQAVDLPSVAQPA